MKFTIIDYVCVVGGGVHGLLGQLFVGPQSPPHLQLLEEG